MVEASDDQGDTKDAKGKQPERDGDDTAEDEETVDESDVEEEDDDEGEDEEPKLKYARLTAHLLPVYRNGDATSAFLVAGDKMVGPRREVCLGAPAKLSTVRWHSQWQHGKYPPRMNFKGTALISNIACYIPSIVQISTIVPRPRQCIHFLHLDFSFPSASAFCPPRRC